MRGLADAMSRIFPPPDVEEPLRASNVQLPEDLWSRLDAIAEFQTEKRKGLTPKPRKVVVSRNDAIRYLLEWACDEAETEMKAEGWKPKKK